MAVNLIGDTAFGMVFNGLVEAVLEATTRVTTFSSSLNSLKTTLAPLKCYFDQVETLNGKLHSPQRETDMFILRLAEGESLVRKCTRIKWWNLYKKYSYSKKIADLERSLIRFFQLDVQAEMVRDHKMLLVGEADLHEQLNAVNHRLDRLLSVVKNHQRSRHSKQKAIYSRKNVSNYLQQVGMEKQMAKKTKSGEETFEEYLSKVKEGKDKIAAGALLPY
ncbi:RPW8-like protein 3 [Coffea arabica]|uniref:RPW8-like protein 3 n=1 Tax=Coffea arabica TaxID=13443 RepID=A0ABM4V9K2_COFAR